MFKTGEGVVAFYTIVFSHFINEIGRNDGFDNIAVLGKFIVVFPGV